MVPYLSSFIHGLVCRSLEQLDQAFLDTVKQKVAACIEGANNQQMKEIRYRYRLLHMQFLNPRWSKKG
jgi:hypothetical protein